MVALKLAQLGMLILHFSSYSSGVPIIWNHTQIQLNISPGTGLNYSVIATVATKVSNPVFVSYNPPISVL